MISLTIDVEQYGEVSSSSRYVESLEPLLSRLDLESSKATFFVVGELVADCAELLNQLHRKGHEIGLHGYSHRHLARMTQDEFRNELERGRGILGDLLGTAPSGFRAPYFSLTRESMWAPNILAESGFVYSSSVLPAFNPQAGLPGAPRRPFLWPSGLVELPSPTLGVGPFGLPVIGGAYLRLLPHPVVSWAKHRATRTLGSWTYCHPYDFDVTEPFFRRHGESWLFSKLLFARRDKMLNRVGQIISDGSARLVDYATDPNFTRTLDTWPKSGTRPPNTRQNQGIPSLTASDILSTDHQDPSR